MEKYINLYNQINELLEKLQSKKFEERKKYEYYENNINKKREEIEKINEEIQNVEYKRETILGYNEFMEKTISDYVVGSGIGIILICLILFAYVWRCKDPNILFFIGEYYDSFGLGLLFTSAIISAISILHQSRDVRKIYKENNIEEVEEQLRLLEEKKRKIQVILEQDINYLEVQALLNEELEKEINKTHQYATYLLGIIDDSLIFEVSDKSYREDEKLQDIVKLVRSKDEIEEN